MTFVSWEPRIRSREKASKRYNMEDKEPCRRDDLRRAFRRKSIRKTLPHASLSSLRARSIFPERFFPRAISRAAFALFQGENREWEREGLSFSFSFSSIVLPRLLSSQALPLVGSRGTTTGRVPEIIVRIDPRATRTGWIYSRARGERRNERKGGTERADERAPLLNRSVFEMGAVATAMSSGLSPRVFPNLSANGMQREQARIIKEILDRILTELYELKNSSNIISITKRDLQKESEHEPQFYMQGEGVVNF